MIPLAIMMISDEDDRELVRRLFLQNERSMYMMAIRIVKEHHTACDIVSMTCVKMIEKTNYLRSIDLQKQTPYILSIVRNTAYSYLRKRRTEKLWTVPDERMLDSISDDNGIDDALICEAENQLLHEAIQRLKPANHDLLVMKYFTQMSDEAISKELGIAKDSVRCYLTRARHDLKKELEKERV